MKVDAAFSVFAGRGGGVVVNPRLRSPSADQIDTAAPPPPTSPPPSVGGDVKGEEEPSWFLTALLLPPPFPPLGSAATPAVLSPASPAILFMASSRIRFANDERDISVKGSAAGLLAVIHR